MAGGSDSSSGNDDPISAINVTPLVDVALVLLVIFMITAPVLYQSAIKVELPKAKTGEGSEHAALEFTLDTAGNVLWKNERVTWEELEARLKKLGPQPPDETAVISADTATPHGRVVKLMDLLRQAGLTRFAMNVEAEK